MLPLPLTVHLDRQASNELERKALLEVFSKAMLERDLAEEDPTNGGRNILCLYDICLLHSLGWMAFIY